MSDHKRKAPAAGQPITRHPLFPAIVALWTGAILAVASLAVPPSLVEGLIQPLRIDRIVPMAAPPLGTTARVLIALAATGFGGILGGIAAFRLARPPRDAAAPARTVAAAKPADREPEIAPPVAEKPSGRRRSLALESRAPERQSDKRDAGRPGILNLAELDLAEFEPAADPAKADAGDADAPPLRPNALFDAFSHDIAPSDDGTEAVAELAEAPVEDTAFPAEAGSPETGAPLAARTPTDRIASAALADLSPVELLERLALAMAHRKERTRTTAPLQLPETAPVVADQDALPEQPLDLDPQLPAGQDAPLVHVPAALRPIDIDAFADADGDDALPGYIPPRSIAIAPGNAADVPPNSYSSLLDLSRPGTGKPRTFQPDITGDDADPAQSVVAFPAEDARPFERPGANTSAGAQPSADDTPGGRRFDGPGGDDPEDTERALRKALETLQRMSGAA